MNVLDLISQEMLSPTERDYYCECCERKLNPNRMAWLEKSFVTNKWFRPGDCPRDESQGCFPFGVACAKKTLAKNER